MTKRKWNPLSNLKVFQNINFFGQAQQSVVIALLLVAERRASGSGNWKSQNVSRLHTQYQNV